ncbi:MAG: hypothetical protein QOG55_1328 [Acidobacteriaceae bacterium]|jgi:hypothetical protein|nr:hypothetical protein [Acidobacteriaceae bacterium]
MKKTTFFDPADPAPERIVRNLASEYVKVKTKVMFSRKLCVRRNETDALPATYLQTHT